MDVELAKGLFTFRGWLVILGLGIPPKWFSSVILVLRVVLVNIPFVLLLMMMARYNLVDYDDVGLGLLDSSEQQRVY